MALPMPDLAHHVARVNGIRLHYVTAGEGPPLYLLHGYPQTWFMWRKVVPLLAPRFRLVMPDLRGYGDSDKPPEGYDKRTMASDVRELARALGDERFARGVLPEKHRQDHPVGVPAAHQLLETHALAGAVRHLDADRGLPDDIRNDADILGPQRPGDVA